jgi:hypothetical protein
MTQLDASFGVDHVTFSNLTPDNGFHQKLSLLNLATPFSLPPLTTVKAIVYTNIDNASVNQGFFYNGTSNFQFTPCLPLRAAVSFDGTIASPITVFKNSFNVTNITQTGNVYTINFTNAIPTNLYYVLGTAGRSDGVYSPMTFQPNSVAYGSAYTTASFSFYVTNGTNTKVQGNIINVMIFGG